VANYSSVNFNGIYFPDYSGLQAQVKPMEKPPKFVTDVVQPEDLGDDWDEAEPEALPVKRRGRPPKSEAVMAVLKSPEEPAKRGPGRPRKQPKDTSGKNLFVDFNLSRPKSPSFRWGMKAVREHCNNWSLEGQDLS
jgi:hypothetical protein